MGSLQAYRERINRSIKNKKEKEFQHKGESSH